ncbi:HPF/RaiA family ribosome-associated protein [Inhella proteolytica]|uniref:HPF/RaiA family ribosome-associated protein n=1 Tax=Inhella proteolytica TaxID=2795029 RepID=A0A931J0T6_9BURK|nr:HPF/RaiA family ribosome-associated protein [Inhella proteolytica]MBH9575563.1 HPF/RaiA family ribosome-associated protein [Inhella proteolytica]
MDIRWVAQGRDLRPWAALAVQRVRRSLGRLAWWVAAVQIRLRDLNGPRGGCDKECQLLLRSRQGQHLVLTERGADWPRLLAQLVEALAGQVGRLHERLHERLRVRPRARQTQRALLVADTQP